MTEQEAARFAADYWPLIHRLLVTGLEALFVGCLVFAQWAIYGEGGR